MTHTPPHKRRGVVDLRKGGDKIAVKRAADPQTLSFKRYAFVNRSAPHKETPAQKKKRRTPLKQRRAYKRRGVLYATFAVMVLGAAGLSALTFHQSVAISSVIVEGTRQISAAQIETSTLQALLSHEGMLYSRNTILTADLSAVGERLRKDFPRIEDISVRRYGMNTVKVTITERIPFATWCDASGEGLCYHADETGFIFEEASGAYVYPALRGGVTEGQSIGAYVLPGIFNRLRGFVVAFRDIEMQSDAISISDDGVDMRMSFENNPDIIVLLDDDPVRVAQTIHTARTAAPVKEKYAGLEYIDARFGNRLYYKSRTADEPTDEGVNDEQETLQ